MVYPAWKPRVCGSMVQSSGLRVYSALGLDLRVFCPGTMAWRLPEEGAVLGTSHAESLQNADHHNLCLLPLERQLSNDGRYTPLRKGKSANFWQGVEIMVGGEKLV
jgi:hypothetical protein